MDKSRGKPSSNKIINCEEEESLTVKKWPWAREMNRELGAQSASQNSSFFLALLFTWREEDPNHRGQNNFLLRHFSYQVVAGDNNKHEIWQCLLALITSS